MVRRARAWPVVVAFAAIALAILVLGANLVSASSAPAQSEISASHFAAPDHSAPATAASAVSVSPAATNWQIVGPYSGTYFNASSSLPYGDANYATSTAVDPVNGIVFAANAFAGTVTSFGLAKGTVLHSVIVSDPVQGTVLPNIVLDTQDHLLFVTVRSNSGDGWIRVLNEGNLALVGNITFTSVNYPEGVFDPMYAAYDPGTDQVFVESTLGNIVVINAAEFVANGAALALTGVLQCTVPRCESRGITEVTALNELIEPTNTSAVLVRPDADLANVTNLTGTPSKAVTAFAAYNSANGYLYVDNYTTHGYSNFLLYSMTTDSYYTSLTRSGQQAPPYVSSMGYDPISNSVLVTDMVNSTEIWAYNGTNGNVSGHYSGGAINVATPRLFTSLSLDELTDQVVGSGSYYNSTITFSLPHLASVKAYSSFPTVQDLIGVDTTAGLYYVTGGEPSTLAAFSLSTEAPAWVDYLPSAIAPQPVNRTAFDSSTHVIYLAEGDANRTIVGIDGYTGQVSSSWQLGPTSGVPDAIAIDSGPSLLYVTTLGRIAAYNLTTGALLNAMATPAVAGCAIAINVTGVAFFVNCATPGTVESYNGLTGTPGPTWTSPALADPVELAISSVTDSVYVAAAGAKNLTIVNPTDTSGINATVTVSPSVPITASLDRALNVSFVSAWKNLTLNLVSTNGDPAVIQPSIPEPTPINHTGYYANTETIYGAELVTGSTYTLTPVTAPAAPGAPAVTAGNGTLAAAWNPPPSGHAPVTNYTVGISTSPNGPFTNQTIVTQTTCAFGGLTNGVPYYIAVYASNIAGSGPFGPAGTNTPVTVPYPPADLAKVSVTDSSISVTWNPPSVTGGTTVTGYQVRWNTTGLTQWQTEPVAAPPYNITNLLANQTYEIQVSATNGAGMGHFTASLNVTTNAVPTNPPPSSGGGSGGGSSGFLGLSAFEWLGIGAILAGVLIIAVVALWGRGRNRSKSVPVASGAPVAAAAVAPSLPEPAAPPPGRPIAPWDEGPDRADDAGT